MWLVCTSSIDSNIHVVPLDDLRDHEASSNCWCSPVEDDEDCTVLNYNAMDRREAFERGERRPS